MITVRGIDVNGFTMIFLLVILGGVVAYVGDRIGMKIGRKRLSIFGLRPRYTSIIITIITGVMISAVTLGIMTLVSQDVRTALFRMKDIQEKLATTEDNLKLTLKELDERQDEADVLTQQVAQISSVYDDLKARYDDIQVQLDSAIESKNKVETELSNVENELVVNERNLDDINRRYNLAQTELSNSNSRLRTSQEEIERLGTEKSELQSYIAELRETRDSLEEDVTRLEKTVADFTNTSMMLAENMDRTKLGTVIFTANQVVLGRVIDCSGSSDYKLQQLNEFLYDLEAIAFDRGAFPDENDENSSAVIFENTNTNDVFQKIDISTGKMIIRAISPLNSIYGEPLLVLLSLFDDEKIFSEGQVIASREIDSGKRAEDIQQEILNIMQDVNNSAVAKGMPTDEEGRIGTILSVAEFASIISDIVSYEQKVVVKVVASNDIWRSDASPSIDLVVEPVEG